MLLCISLQTFLKSTVNNLCRFLNSVILILFVEVPRNVLARTRISLIVQINVTSHQQNRHFYFNFLPLSLLNNVISVFHWPSTGSFSIFSRGEHVFFVFILRSFLSLSGLPKPSDLARSSNTSVFATSSSQSVLF